MTTALRNGKLPDDKALLAERRAWAAEIEKLEGEHLKALPPLTDAVTTTAEAVAVTKTAHDKSLVEHRAAAGRVSAANLRYSRGRDLLEGQLRESVPEIDTFVAELQAESSRLQISGHPSPVADRRLAAANLRVRRLAAEELRLQALTPAELAERLDAIREGGVDEVEA